MINVLGKTVCACIRDTKEQFLLADKREREREKKKRLRLEFHTDGSSTETAVSKIKPQFLVSSYFQHSFLHNHFLLAFPRLKENLTFLKRNL